MESKISQLSHAVPKKDKKAKDELTAKVKVMEEELAQKHKEELSKFDAIEKTLASNINELLITTEPKAPSKAYLKKAKKQAEEDARLKKLEEEKKNYISKSVIEFADFAKKLSPLSKYIVNIKSDGDCLYSALANQMSVNGMIGEQEAKTYHKRLRAIAADFIRANRIEFEPYVISEDEYGDAEDPIEEYCQQSVLQSGTWGGHIELKALSCALERAIIIYHAYSPDVTIGEEYNTKPAFCLSYHKHAFTLGEHYNSVVTTVSSTTDDS
eukprot:gene3721-4290_t